MKRAWLLLLACAMLMALLVSLSNRFTASAEAAASAPATAVARESAVAIQEQPDNGVEEARASDVAAQNLALFFGRDDRVFISTPYAQPYSAVGKMETVGESRCTATLVAPDLAVTAAHCFLMTPHKLDQGKWFWAGYHQGKWQARYRVEAQVFHPKFRQGLDYKGEDVYIKPSAAPYDIAWLKLKFIDGVAPAPMPIYTGNHPDDLLARIQRHDSKVTQAGFAHDHREQLTAHQGCAVTGLIDDNTLEHQCDTLSGDSGSPLWLTTENGPLLIAVQSSAPDWFNRDKADNTAVTVLQLPKKPK